MSLVSARLQMLSERRLKYYYMTLTTPNWHNDSIADPHILEGFVETLNTEVV